MECNDFDAGKSITRAIGRVCPRKSRLFWALKWQRVKRVPVRPFRTPLPMAQVTKYIYGFAPTNIIKSNCHMEKQVYW